MVFLCLGSNPGKPWHNNPYILATSIDVVYLSAAYRKLRGNIANSKATQRLKLHLSEQYM